MNDGLLQLIDQEEDSQSGKYLTFIVDNEEYGIEIRFVTEIIGIQPIHSFPEVPVYVKGILNLRGKIVPVAYMRLRFEKTEAAYTDRTCIVVVETKRFTAGLIVDQVSEVMVIEAENIVLPPDIQLMGSRRYISGVGRVGAKIKLLINCEKLFDSDETSSMEKINTGEVYEVF